MNGWVKVPRTILENEFLEQPKLLRVFLFLVKRASIKERTITVKGHVINLKPGELVIGRKILSDECKLPETTIENILKDLCNSKIIGQIKYRKFRLISILCEENKEDFGHLTNSISAESRLNNSSISAESRLQNGHYKKKKKIKEKEEEEEEEVNKPSPDFENSKPDGELETGDISNYPTDADYYYEIGLTGNGSEHETPQNTIGSDIANENGTGDTHIPPDKKKSVKTKKNEDTKTHTEIIKLYSEWMESRNLPARIDASDAAAVKKIVSYLSKFEKVQSGERTVVDLLKYIFDNWNTLPGWNQNQTQLRQINSQLPTIIEMIKNKSNGTATSKQNDHYNELDRLSKTIRENLTNGYGL